MNKQNQDKTKDELLAELDKLKEELEVQTWGQTKTNEAIKVLYRELEARNKQLQELDQLKSDFINSVSHELRTPLTTIREAISQIKEEILGPTTQQQREFLAICLQDVDRLKRIIDDLLDISKFEAGKVKLVRQEIDIAPLAKGVIAAFLPSAKNKNLEIREKFLSDKAVAYADRDRVIQVFTNLIGNALKFTEAGYIEVVVEDKPQNVECSVADTGRGISEDDLGKVFGKFQQFNRPDGSKDKGTGLGLSISKSIVDLHKGKIWVESKLNAGTKFIFTLPKYNAKELYREHITEELAKAIRERRFLSVCIFDIGGLSEQPVIEGVVNFIKQNLRRQEEVIIKDKQKILVVFYDTQKEKAIEIAERTRRGLGEYLSKSNTQKEFKVRNKVVGYPQDGSNQDDIYSKIESDEGFM